jgi:uncharacterized protein (DUF58 family)
MTETGLPMMTPTTALADGPASRARIARAIAGARGDTEQTTGALRVRKGPSMQDPKDPRTSGKVAMYAILVITALTAIMVWVAA